MHRCARRCRHVHTHTHTYTYTYAYAYTYAHTHTCTGARGGAGGYARLVQRREPLRTGCVHMRIRTCTGASPDRVCAHAYTYASPACTYIYICIGVGTGIVCTGACAHVHRRVCTCACLHAHAHDFMPMYARMHMCTCTRACMFTPGRGDPHLDGGIHTESLFTPKAYSHQAEGRPISRPSISWRELTSSPPSTTRCACPWAHVWPRGHMAICPWAWRAWHACMRRCCCPSSSTDCGRQRTPSASSPSKG